LTDNKNCVKKKDDNFLTIFTRLISAFQSQNRGK